MRAPRIALLRRLTVLAIMICVMALTILIYQYARLSAFRAKPEWHVFEEEISDASLLSPLIRYIIFKKGSQEYEDDLFKWLRRIELDGAPFDAAVMERFLGDRNKRELVQLTGAFAKYPNPLTPHLKKRLFSATTGCIFARMNEDEVWSLAGEEYDDEPEEPTSDIVDIPEDDDARENDSAVKEGEFEPYDPLAEASYAYAQDGEATIPWMLEFEQIEDADLRKRVVECISSLSPNASQYFPMRLVPKSGNEASRLLETLIHQRNATLIANVSMSNSIVSKRALAWLIANVETISEDHLTHIHASPVSPELRQALFRRWIKEGIEQRAIATLRQTLLDGDDVLAQKMARPIIDGPDSSLKKDLIVILARNHTRLGVSNVDKAFVGKPPRRELFYSYDDYFNSDTMARYSEISGHGYLEVGKSFPAIYCLPPSDNEEQLLRDFIVTYPWFPATDDAHLRLASRLFLDGRFDDSQTELRRLSDAPYLDQDAKDLIPEADKLLRSVRNGHKPGPTAQEWYLENLKNKCPTARRASS